MSLKRRVVERSSAWTTRFRQLVKDYERYTETLAPYDRRNDPVIPAN
jgi:hypothetical protein